MKSLPSWQWPLAALRHKHENSEGRAWATIARYDDGFVDELRSRGGDGLGVSSNISWGGVGGTGTFDSGKMFRTCARLGQSSIDDETTESLASNSNVRE
jgi:phosphatidylinositol-3,4,5-trisphosphate 3-phosphatase/dual-specificity protein phosphatase PTEN